MRARCLVAGLLVVSAVACQRRPPPENGPASRPATVAPPETVTQSGLVTAGGIGDKRTFLFSLHFKAPQVGELFSVDTDVGDAATGKPVAGVTFSLDATMPAHGHGMITDPVHAEVAPGRWHSEGMKMHMPGRWLLEIRANLGDKHDVLRIPYDEPPAAL